MKNLLILGFCISLTSCGTTGMQGNPGAIMVGAQVGSVVGSVIGSSSDSFAGWAIGSIAGTVAGAAIGNAISTPHNTDQTYSNSSYQDNTYPEPATSDERGGGSSSRNETEYQAPALPVSIQNIRFVDDNNNHIIESGEFCKLIFELVNTSDQIVYNIYPDIRLSSKRVGISNPALIQKLLPGQRMRYTASVYGYSNLKDGTVDFSMAICQQNSSSIGDQKQFTLETRRR